MTKSNRVMVEKAVDTAELRRQSLRVLFLIYSISPTFFADQRCQANEGGGFG